MPTIAQQSEKLVRRWFDEVWNKKHLELIDELLSMTAVDHGQPEIGTGRGAHKHHAERFLQAFPDLFVTIDELHADGNMVTVRGTHRATHKGTWAGAKATDRKVVIPWSSRIRVEDGRIAEAWTEMDTTSFLRQINDDSP